MPLIDPVTMSGMSGVSQNRLSRPSVPIEVLPTALPGSNYAPLVFLLSAFYLRFSALIADPVPVLLQAVVPVAICQVTYCVYCLPITGTSSKVTKRTQKGKGSTTKKINGGSAALAKASHTILSLFLTLLTIPFILTTQILLGAPLTTHLPHTILSSTHLALLAFFPLIYVHGVDSSKWLEVLSAQSPFDEVFGAAVGTGVGAWLGAIPIPLDWDREWQKWPVTIVVGMYMGWAVGKLLGGWILKGRRIVFD